MVDDLVMISLDDIFIYPTDTVWGLGGMPYSRKVYEKIMEAKHMNASRPFSILFCSVAHFREYFDCPKVITDEWLEGLFGLQSSFAIPIQWAKKEIPPWVNCSGPFIAIRCLPFEGIKGIIQRVQSPIITTSLNLSGAPPIKNKPEAISFYKENMRGEERDDVLFVEDEDVVPSGAPSTIVALDERGTFTYWRLGEKIKQIKVHCQGLVYCGIESKGT